MGSTIPTAADELSTQRHCVHFRICHNIVRNQLQKTKCMDDSWYTEEEIDTFKKDAKMYILALRKLKLRRERSKNKIPPSSVSRKKTPSKTLCRLGLESRIDVERLRRRRRSIKKIINAQNTLKSSTSLEREQCLAVLSSIESFSAKCKALEEGSITLNTTSKSPPP